MGAASNIDLDISFHNAKEIIRFLPRAAQIAFLSPFPNQWLKSGSLEHSGMMRKISGVEMVGIYISLIFLPYAVWYWRKKTAMWVIISFYVSVLLIYGITIPNVGTLYRFRYGFIMTFVALGAAGGMQAWPQIFKTKRKKIFLDKELAICAVLQV